MEQAYFHTVALRLIFTVCVISGIPVCFAFVGLILHTCGRFIKGLHLLSYRFIS